MAGAPVLAGEPTYDAAAVIALGSNLAGDYPSSRALLEDAATAVAALGDPFLIRSSWWRSAAWPDAGDPPFLNGVSLLSSPLEPEELLRALKDIAFRFGRRPAAANAPRALDLDLIACGRRRLDTPHLAIPHPRAHQRRFVMGPLAEIAPAWRHPVLGLTAGQLAEMADVGADAAPAP
jgi:2-amino-4-hydroxy-6-hydroxymethyldihydropteridine diphosphokinase